MTAIQLLTGLDADKFQYSGSGYLDLGLRDALGLIQIEFANKTHALEIIPIEYSPTVVIW